MLDFTLESIGAISVLKLRGIMETPDVPILSEYCAIDRSILVVDLLDTKNLLPEGHRILFDAADRVKTNGGRMIFVAHPDQSCGREFSMSNDLVVFGARDQAITSAKEMHRDRCMDAVNTEGAARVGSFGRFRKRSRPHSPEVKAEGEARKEELEQEIIALQARRDRALEEDRIAVNRLEDLKAAAATVEAVAAVEAEEMKAELNNLIAQREEYRNDLEKHQQTLREERRASLEACRVEEAAIRMEIAYLKEARASLAADIDKAKKSLISSASREVVDMENRPIPVKKKTLKFRPIVRKDVFARSIFSRGVTAVMIAGGLSLLIGSFFLPFLARSGVAPSFEPVAVVQAPAVAQEIAAVPEKAAVPAPAPAASAAPAKKMLTLRILNGTGKNGLAAGVEAVLPRAEFKVIETKNADRFGYSRTIIRAAKEDAERVRDAMNLGVVEIAPHRGADVVVILGADARNVFRARPRNIRSHGTAVPTVENPAPEIPPAP